MAGPATSEAEELAHEHAVRALDQQAGVLDNIRARTAILIAATSLVATFLGGQALAAQTNERWLDIAAVAPLLALAWGMYLAIRVLQPTKKDADKPPEENAGLQLTINARALLDRPEARGVGEEGIRAFVARCAQSQWEGNNEIIDGKLDEFTRATFGLLLQVMLWIALLIGKGVI